MEKKDDKKKMTQVWTKEQEQLLAEWSEKASGYRWLHSRAEKLYRCRNYTFTIPVIILSTLTGTANFAMDSFVPEENKQMAMACVGGVNIFAGILSTLQNFLRYAELMEGHRLALVSWSKFGRDIAVELALEPKMRKPAFDFLTVCRAEFDRLIEQSPSIDDDIIKSFKKTFKKSDVRVPEICNGLHRVSVYEPSQEEKVASIMATAANKVKPTRKLWAAVDVNKAANILETNHVKHQEDKKNKSDIHELKNLGKVSMFKDKMNNNKSDVNDENMTPNIELKELINKNEDLLNPSIDEQKTQNISEETLIPKKDIESQENINTESNEVVNEEANEVVNEEKNEVVNEKVNEEVNDVVDEVVNDIETNNKSTQINEVENNEDENNEDENNEDENNEDENDETSKFLDGIK
jgi:hypothetical protein